MRAILEFTATRVDGKKKIHQEVKKSLRRLGWHEGVKIERNDLVAIAKLVLGQEGESPTSPESKKISDAIEGHFKPERKKLRKAGDLDSKRRRYVDQFLTEDSERHFLQNAVLILTQIDERERSEAFHQGMTTIQSSDGHAVGVLFRHMGGTKKTATYTARFRYGELYGLKRAAARFASAVHPTKTPGKIRTLVSEGGAVGTRGRKEQRFVSEVKRLEIRSIANEQLDEGQVIPISGPFALFRQVLRRRPVIVLITISVLLALCSALIFQFAPDSGWWEWTEQLLGRLATGAFGALLVDGAFDYGILRSLLKSGSGNVTHGALIDWQRS